MIWLIDIILNFIVGMSADTINAHGEEDNMDEDPTMLHIINGQKVNLRHLTDDQLRIHIRHNIAQRERLDEELDSLGGEERRRHNRRLPLSHDRNP